MNCFYHTDQQAVALCNGCKKGLCPSCASKFTPSICPDCYRIYCKELVQSNINSLVGFILFFIGGCICGLFCYYLINASNPDGLNKLPVGRPIIALYFGYVLGATWYGWKVLSNIQKFKLQSAWLIIWILYLFLKVYISSYVGIVATPFQIIKNIRNIRKYSKKYH